MSLPPYEFTPARFESNLDASSGSVYFVQDKGTKGLFSFSTKGFLAYNNDYEHWTQSHTHAPGTDDPTTDQLQGHGRELYEGLHLPPVHTSVLRVNKRFTRTRK
jgi:hypothetical protein